MAFFHYMALYNSNYTALNKHFSNQAALPEHRCHFFSDQHLDMSVSTVG